MRIQEKNENGNKKTEIKYTKRIILTKSKVRDLDIMKNYTKIYKKM